MKVEIDPGTNFNKAPKQAEINQPPKDEKLLSKNDKSEDEEQEAFPAVDPWPHPVNGEEVAEEIEAVLRKYMVLPEHSPTAITLWVMFSYKFDHFDVCPILAAVSPEKRCGKTSLLSLLTALCQKVLSASNISASAVFRSVEKWQPTLIIDEADTFLRHNDELRGVLNSGHTRATASVIRTVQKGKKFDVERCSTWAPKAIALIGKLPDTLADRSIAVKMRRKRSDEKRERIPYSKLTDQLTSLRRKIARWAVDTNLKEVDAPEKLDDRAADNWLPLLSIADNIGWSNKSIKAALALSGKTDTDTIRTELLRDIYEILQDEKRDAIPSKELLRQLNEMDEKPWPTYHKGNQLSGNGLARLLKPFDISSKTIRFENKTAKGYELNTFNDAFTRYLAVTEVKSLVRKDLEEIAGVTDNNHVTAKKTPKFNKNNVCYGVTSDKGGAGTKEEYSTENPPF